MVAFGEVLMRSRPPAWEHPPRVFDRPFMYALHYGDEGIKHAVEIIKGEIETTMRLSGINDLMHDVHSDFVNTAEIDHLVPSIKHPYAQKAVRSTAKL
ncbi:hypothetical protein PV08_05929 [Exophiala spinifera]|uniref:FMN-dependent dehydrogenase domain-containing protein n=1 Tax=Exophiala spinifera TaxID=91928 RepID=A0A0D2BX54_9EURO|nr:uncharacterized protein PV08_05929 [Exophiala spinifera]KIW15879.1 hypothetical protein PV08_05929 [Exophiala spinifera]